MAKRRGLIELLPPDVFLQICVFVPTEALLLSLQCVSSHFHRLLESSGSSFWRAHLGGLLSVSGLHPVLASLPKALQMEIKEAHDRALRFGLWSCANDVGLMHRGALYFSRRGAEAYAAPAAVYLKHFAEEVLEPLEIGSDSHSAKRAQLLSRFQRDQHAALLPLGPASRDGLLFPVLTSSQALMEGAPAALPDNNEDAGDATYSAEHLAQYTFLLLHAVVTKVQVHCWPAEEKQAVLARLTGPTLGTVETRFFSSVRSGGYPRMFAKLVYCRSSFPVDEMAQRFEEDPSSPQELFCTGYGRVEVDVRPRFSLEAFQDVAEQLGVPDIPLPLLYNALFVASGASSVLAEHAEALTMSYNDSIRAAFARAL